MTDITTLKQARAAIRKAPGVYVQPRFGTSENWVRIAKRDALTLLSHCDEDPDRAEMSTGCFGSIEADGAVLLG